MESQKVHTNIRKHGGGMRLLSSKGKEDKVWKLEERKLNRGVEGVQEK